MSSLVSHFKDLRFSLRDLSLPLLGLRLDVVEAVMHGPVCMTSFSPCLSSVNRKLAGFCKLGLYMATVMEVIVTSRISLPDL